jgi:sec-independent protein translocase protein TatC
VAEPEEDRIDDKPMPLLDHLIELRTRLLWSMGALLVAFGVCYHFSGGIYSYLAEPLAHVLEARGENRRLIFTSLTEGFFTYLKVAFFGAAFISFPIVATQVYLFIAPGLYRSEKRAFLPFLIATPVLFIMGAALAYYFVFPVAWSFFISFETPTGGGGLPIELEAKVGEYLDLVMKLIFAFGIAFQLPVALSLLAYVGMFIIAAILAPPDVITQCGLAVPLIGLYEISILAARFVEPKPAPDTD